MTIETSREYWIRFYAGQAMHALIQLPHFRPHEDNDRKLQAINAVKIAKELLDELESKQDEWIRSNYNRGRA